MVNDGWVGRQEKLRVAVRSRKKPDKKSEKIRVKTKIAAIYK